MLKARALVATAKRLVSNGDESTWKAVADASHINDRIGLSDKILKEQGLVDAIVAVVLGEPGKTLARDRFEELWGQIEKTENVKQAYWDAAKAAIGKLVTENCLYDDLRKQEPAAPATLIPSLKKEVNNIAVIAAQEAYLDAALDDIAPVREAGKTAKDEIIRTYFVGTDRIPAVLNVAETLFLLWILENWLHANPSPISAEYETALHKPSDHNTLLTPELLVAAWQEHLAEHLGKLAISEGALVWTPPKGPFTNKQLLLAPLLEILPPLAKALTLLQSLPTPMVVDEGSLALVPN